MAEKKGFDVDKVFVVVIYGPMFASLFLAPDLQDLYQFAPSIAIGFGLVCIVVFLFFALNQK